MPNLVQGKGWTTIRSTDLCKCFMCCLLCLVSVCLCSFCCHAHHCQYDASHATVAQTSLQDYAQLLFQPLRPHGEGRQRAVSSSMPALLPFSAANPTACAYTFALFAANATAFATFWRVVAFEACLGCEMASHLHGDAAAPFPSRLAIVEASVRCGPTSVRMGSHLMLSLLIYWTGGEVVS